MAQGRKTLQKQIEKAMSERGKWLATATGGFYFLEGQEERDIKLVDVAIGLARKCRYSGNIAVHLDNYSVAEHSDIMAKYFLDNAKAITGRSEVMLEDYLKVKMHDASEFVFPDVPTPIKDMNPAFRLAEQYHDEKTERAFIPDLSGVSIAKKQVKEIDNRIRSDERRAVIAQPAYGAGAVDALPELGVEIRCLEWREAAWSFMEDFIWAAHNLPARLEENAIRAREHAAAAQKFLDNNPRPDSRRELEERIRNLEAENEKLRAEARSDMDVPGM